MRIACLGGSLDNRMRFPLRVVQAVRAASPAAKPLAARISATDRSGPQGVTADEAVQIARLLVAADADLIDVSTGETNPEARPVYGRMFQTPNADQIRNEVGCRTMTVGNIDETDHANSILAAGRADLVALGRQHLINPSWTLHAAAAAGYRGVRIPAAYRPGEVQLERSRVASAGG